MGDAIATNMFMLGCAWQHGLVPLGEAAILRAIELNGAAVGLNQRGVPVGPPRRARPGAGRGRGDAGDAGRTIARLSTSLDEVIARRVDYLTAYQDAAYAERYRDAGRARAQGRGRARSRQHRADRGRGPQLHKLLAYKDEYEVARLYTETGFLQRDRRHVRGRLEATLPSGPAAAGAARPGHRRAAKRGYGHGCCGAFRLLARLKRLRGTRLDPFGYTAERRSSAS